MFLLKRKKKSDRDTSDKTHLPCPLKSVAEIWLIIDRNLDFDRKEHYFIIRSVLLFLLYFSRVGRSM